MRWAATNVAAKTDHAGNLVPDKARSATRIDPFVALVMAVDGYMRRGQEAKKNESVYERRGLVAA